MSNTAEWWPRLADDVRDWLMKYPATENLPAWVAAAVYTAGGPVKQNPVARGQRLDADDIAWIRSQYV